MVQGYRVQEFHYIVKTCFGCEFYHHDMIRSGRHPEYRDSCTHPQAIIDYVGKFVKITDREIRHDQTPDWCPAGQRKEE